MIFNRFRPLIKKIKNDVIFVFSNLTGGGHEDHGHGGHGHQHADGSMHYGDHGTFYFSSH